MKLSSSGHRWTFQPIPFRFQLQVCTNDQEAARVRAQLMEMLEKAGHLDADKDIKKASQRNDAVRLVHWLALNLDQGEKPEVEL